MTLGTEPEPTTCLSSEPWKESEKLVADCLKGGQSTRFSLPWITIYFDCTFFHVGDKVFGGSLKVEEKFYYCILFRNVFFLVFNCWQPVDTMFILKHCSWLCEMEVFCWGWATMSNKNIGFVVLRGKVLQALVFPFMFWDWTLAGRVHWLVSPR
jgi:hypothetical protein